jgi:hypothetical protein
MSEGVYLDNNATTMVSPEVVEAMPPYFIEQCGNPLSMHHFGNKGGMALKKARRQVQELLAVELYSEIVCSSCGTESDSIAILSALKALPERKDIITTLVEHPALAAMDRPVPPKGGEASSPRRTILPIGDRARPRRIIRARDDINSNLPVSKRLPEYFARPGVPNRRHFCAL